MIHAARHYGVKLHTAYFHCFHRTDPRELRLNIIEYRAEFHSQITGLKADSHLQKITFMRSETILASHRQRCSPKSNFVQSEAIMTIPEQHE